MPFPIEEPTEEELELLTNLARRNIPDNDLIMKDYLRKERGNANRWLKRKNALKHVLAGILITIGIAIIYGAASVKPVKEVQDVQDGPDCMLSPDFVKFLTTHGHGKEYSIYDVE